MSRGPLVPHATDEVPLFPLGTVLFPGGWLPLRIFEPRYLRMVAECSAEQRPFGVALIRAGRETGLPAVPHDTGTLATLIDFDREPNGMLRIACVGGARFRILSRRRDPDGLQWASIGLCAEPDDRVLPERHRALAEFLRNLVGQGLVERPVPGDIDYGSAREVGWRLAEALPLQMPERQQLLEIDDPLARMDRIAALMAAMDFTLDA